jgi:hypothetical protein
MEELNLSVFMYRPYNLGWVVWLIAMACTTPADTGKSPIVNEPNRVSSKLVHSLTLEPDGLTLTDGLDARKVLVGG